MRACCTHRSGVLPSLGHSGLLRAHDVLSLHCHACHVSVFRHAFGSRSSLPHGDCARALILARGGLLHGVLFENET